MISDNDIDSIIVTPIGLVNISSYWILIKLRKELAVKLSTGTYTLLMNTGNYEYSGSVNNLLRKPDQYVLIGEMDKKDYQILTNKIPNRILIKNNI
jgi:hypothetical protein